MPRDRGRRLTKIERAEVQQRMYQLRLAGHSLAEIARDPQINLSVQTGWEYLRAEQRAQAALLSQGEIDELKAVYRSQQDMIRAMALEAATATLALGCNRIDDQMPRSPAVEDGAFFVARFLRDTYEEERGDRMGRACETERFGAPSAPRDGSTEGEFHDMVRTGRFTRAKRPAITARPRNRMPCLMWTW